MDNAGPFQKELKWFSGTLKHNSDNFRAAQTFFCFVFSSPNDIPVELIGPKVQRDFSYDGIKQLRFVNVTKTLETHLAHGLAMM